jgi:hypothetical protein
MMNQPLISVIVPIYGIERYVGHCIVNLDYDYVLMAGLDSSFKSLVIRTLADYGVDPEKVLAVEMDYDTRREILMNYLHPKKL